MSPLKTTVYRALENPEASASAPATVTRPEAPRPVEVHLRLGNSTFAIDPRKEAVV